MITRLEALNYRCLRYISQPLDRFHILVGPNASGKTTFLDVIAFLGELLTDGLDAAVSRRSENIQDLTWGRNGDRFELAVEARIPETRRELLKGKPYDTVRYEIAIGRDPESESWSLLAEKVSIKVSKDSPPPERHLFPALQPSPSTVISKTAKHTARAIVKKTPGGNDNYYAETYDESGKGWAPSVRLGPRRSAFANLPYDETHFPAASWLKDFLVEGVQNIVLNSLHIRKASPPGQGRGFKSDGSNLPWVVADLESKAPERLRDWVSHLATALPDLQSVRTVEREDDKHRYLMLRYHSGLEVPSWMASDGTLRLMALTLPAYLPNLTGVFLLEEPENGIHPRAVDTMFQSLSSVYHAQMLIATHSPVILSIADSGDVLCFAKADDGSTDIVRGSDHPQLRDWQGETNLGVLFASGVLG